MDDDLHEGFVQNLIEDVNELRKALEKADDEAESYYRFGEEFPALSDEEDEQPLLSESESEEEPAETNDQTVSPEVKQLQKCIKYNTKFQEMIIYRLAIINAHLNELQTKINELEDLRTKSDLGPRVKNGFCLVSFFGSPYFSDESNKSPPANPDMRENLKIPAVNIYNKIRSCKPGEVERVKFEKEVASLQGSVLKHFKEILIEGYRQELKNVSSDETKEAWQRKIAELDTLSQTEIVAAVPIDKINWNKIAMTVFNGERSPQSCCQMWMNAASPVLFMGPWKKGEDKKLMTLAKHHDYRNWETIARELGTSRSAIHCLTRYQVHLNFEHSKTSWTTDEDRKLSEAVDKYGKKNWTLISREIGGRTPNQCLQRWSRSVGFMAHNHDSPLGKGKWTTEEDERLTDGVKRFGQTWVKIAKVVQTRTDRQCRERWCRHINPDLKKDEWTQEEDEKLKDLALKYNKKGSIKWSALAKEMIGRTDSQCRLRFLNLQSNKEDLIKYIKHSKKSQLLEFRNKSMKYQHGPLSGHETELRSEDVDDDMLPEKDQVQIARLVDKIPQLLPSSQATEQESVSGVEVMQEEMEEEIPIDYEEEDPGYPDVLPPYDNSHLLGSSWLTSLDFVRIDDPPVEDMEVSQSEDVASQHTSTDPQAAATPASSLQLGAFPSVLLAVPPELQSIYTPKKDLAVTTQTIISYCEYKMEPPKPFSPLVPAYHPTYHSTPGVHGNPLLGSPPHFPPPNTVANRGMARPVYSQYFGISAPNDQKLTRKKKKKRSVLERKFVKPLPLSEFHQNVLARVTFVYDYSTKKFVAFKDHLTPPTPYIPSYTCMPSVAQYSQTTPTLLEEGQAEVASTSISDSPLLHSSHQILMELIQQSTLSEDEIIARLAPLYGLSCPSESTEMIEVEQVDFASGGQEMIVNEEGLSSVEVDQQDKGSEDAPQSRSLPVSHYTISQNTSATDQYPSPIQTQFTSNQQEMVATVCDEEMSQSVTQSSEIKTSRKRGVSAHQSPQVRSSPRVKRKKVPFSFPNN